MRDGHLLTRASLHDVQGGAASSPAGGDTPSQRVLRTVYLPSERADALLLTTQSLQQQVDELRRLMDERSEVRCRGERCGVWVCGW